VIDFANASYSGVVAGSAIAIAFIIGRAGGLNANSELMLGTIVVGRSAALAWLTGAGISVITFGAVGLLYAAGFEYVTHTAGLVAGVGLAIAHTVISGLSLAMLPAVHPSMRMRMALEPGIFKSNYGALDTNAFVLLHLIYGALFGVIYSPLAESAHRW
jgi:hypothetical protein